MQGASISQFDVRDVVWRENLGGEHLELGEQRGADLVGKGPASMAQPCGRSSSQPLIDELQVYGACCLEPGWVWEAGGKAQGPTVPGCTLPQC